MILQTPSLTFTEAISASANKIIQFKGRSRRSEFWWTQLLVYALSFVFSPFVGFVLDLLMIPLAFRRLHDIGRSGWWWVLGIVLKTSFFFYFFYNLIIINYEGSFDSESDLIMSLISKCLTFLLVVAGYQIIMIVLCCFDSYTTTNEYGDSPKYIKTDNNA